MPRNYALALIWSLVNVWISRQEARSCETDFDFRYNHFPTDNAATKLIWRALRNIAAKWKNPPIAWAMAKAQFAIQFGERFTLSD